MKVNLGPHAVTRFAVIGFLPVLKLRDIYPPIAIPCALLALALLFLPFFSGPNQSVGKVLKWWWCLPALLFVQWAEATIFGIVPANALFGNAVTIIGAVLAGTAMYAKRMNLSLITDTVVNSIAALVVVSTTLYILGINSAHQWSIQTGYSSILSNLGIFVHRTGMPMTGGGGRHSTLSALVLVGVLLRFLLDGRVTIFGSVAVACALWGLAIGDGRSAMVGGVAGVVFAVFFKGRFLRWAALSLPVGFLSLSVFSLMLPRDWAVWLSRTGEAGEIADGNGRMVIWQAAFDHLSHTPAAALLGMGQFGQVTSGIVRKVGGYGSFESAQLLSMHNIGMQLLIDGGVVGLALTTVWLFYACKGLERYPVAAGMMMTMLVAGLTDVWLTHYVDEGFFTFSLLAMVGLLEIRPQHGKVPSFRYDSNIKRHPVFIDN
ncbi:O-antigen ligase family protein [Altericroceibacterium endophyticum]|uniref:O-antigen ligase domain-containing protein n=1 Tax=Altericroceibacterium endophyticum TaxID=1808508 RepID=A0A6I4TBG3_9SPHN|nr:O-antigen ligase family protein [Altericroceibacterium endophyticum]MXO67075.1 hypothetical protein [Altericroceibacterium endophyticum]